MTEVKKKQMRTKWTIPLLQEVCKKHGFVLISTEYTNTKTKIDIICSCGRPNSTLIQSIKDGRKCKECGITNRKHNKRTQQEAETIFSEQDCVLLDIYEDSAIPVNFLCKCNRAGYKSVNTFLKNPVCRACSYEQVGQKNKHSMDAVQQFFLEENCILLDDAYQDNKTPLRYQCQCGNNSLITLAHFLRGIRCEDCINRKRVKYNTEYIKEMIESEGCQYISHEKDSFDTEVTIICTCGRKGEVHLPSFRLGSKCRICGRESISEKMSGENHHNWKGGISYLSNYLRQFLSDWKKESFKFCDYKCAISQEKSNGKFEVHHLYSVNLIINDINTKLELEIKPKIQDYTEKELNSLSDLFIKENNKILGVVLSPAIHKLYHLVYGYGDNTPEQFEEFKQRYSNGEFDEILNERKIS